MNARPRFHGIALDPWVCAAVLAFFALLFLALFGERIAPHEPIYFVVEHDKDPRPFDPGIVFPFGSDVLGRDLFSLVLAGARATLTIILLGGVARVTAGVLVAAVSSWWRPTRLATESLAELVSAVPATLVALLIVKVFVRTDTSIFVFIGALLVTGWAGPYRVIRAEVDRLSRAPFTQGAVSVGVGRWRLFRHHHLPHLVPLIGMNLSQQIVASLVLVAELGVLNAFVGSTRIINIEESLRVVRFGPPSFAVIADPPEWGGLLASGRTLESLWTTRWLFLVPGVAFAITAVAVATVGFAVARRYARRDIAQDLRGPGTAVLAAAVLSLFVVSSLVPERYAAAREWAAAARAELRPSGDTASAFGDAGLRPLGADYAIRRETSNFVRVRPATAMIGAVTVDEVSSRQDNPPLNSRHMEAFVTAGTGGGVVDAPLVFAARGISPSEIPLPLSTTLYAGKLPELGTLVKDYPDDWAGIDVRGKVVLLVRFLGVATRPPSSRSIANVQGIPPETGIASAIKRGARAVLYVDPALPLYTDGDDQYTYALGGAVGGPNPYLRMEQDSPPTAISGVPVIVLSPKAASTLVAPLGVDLTPFIRLDTLNEYANTRGASRDLGLSARVEVPLERRTAVATSFVGEVGDAAGDSQRVLLWAPRKEGANPTSEVLSALARVLGARKVPFVFVDFDPSIDPKGNTASIAELLKGRHIGLVLVLDKLDGNALRFTTPYGDLIPAIDLYADKAAARHHVTHTTATIGQLSGIAPFIDIRTVVVNGNGGDGDVRPDAAAFVGYLAGRLMLGAEELSR